MTSPAERLLELALAEVIGGRRPPELTTRILASRRSTPRWPWLLGGIVVLCLALAATLWLTRPPQLSPAERDAATGWLELQLESLAELDPRDQTTRARSKAVWQARRDLLDLLEAKPAGWGWIREWIRPRLEEARDLNVRQQLLAILVRQPRAANDPALLERLHQEPEAFDAGSLLVLLEGGHAPARELLERRLDEMPPVPPLALPAAALALDGDPRGAEVLRFLLAIPVLRDAQPAVSLACAAGLRRLGEEGVWEDTVAALRRAAEAHLRAGELDAARRIVVSLATVPDVVAAATPRLGDLDRHVDRQARALADELPDAAALQQRLDELRIP
jgi:hypothetical protein